MPLEQRRCISERLIKMRHLKYPDYSEIINAFEFDGENLIRKDYVDARGRYRDRKLVENRKNCSRGYCRVDYKETMYFYHVIMWILHNGNIPKGCIIDHVDGNKLNNHISNLRAITQRQNSQNKEVHRNGKLYGCGFDARRNLWRARAKVGDKHVWIGYYKTELEAHEAYKNFVASL